MGMAALLAAEAAHSGVNETPAMTANEIADRISRRPVFLEPLVWVGEKTPPLQESQELWEVLDVFNVESIAIGMSRLEQFIDKFPNSAWTPSLRCNLAEYYRQHGRYSLALNHWENAWNTTSPEESRNGKKVADFALVNWTRLLASLGRTDTLKRVFEETSTRVLDSGPLQQIFNATKEGFRTMTLNPGISYLCGTLALSHICLELGISNELATQVLKTPSPETGFSMAELAGLALKAGVPVLPVERTGSQELVVPSIVHWKLNHYAAIIKKGKKSYLVKDPTFGSPVWMTAEDIMAEASGYFMIPNHKITEGWRVLNQSESSAIFGRGYPNNICDPCEQFCLIPEGASPTCPCQNQGGGSGDGGGGGCKSGCTFARGKAMAAWKVSEPYITLWVYDTPLFYPTSTGREFSFQLSYKQRNSRSSSYIFGIGPLWECSWLSYVKSSRNDEGGWNEVLYVLGGGERAYADGAMDYQSGSILTNYLDGGGNRVYEVQYPNGSKDLYTYPFGFTGVYVTNWFLTAQIDVNGRTSRFYYETTPGNAVHLTHVVDWDGLTNTIYYTNANFPDLITSVRNPYSKETFLIYDNQGRLTNVTDMIQIQSSFRYDSESFITNLITPYGITRFQKTANSYHDPTYGYMDFGGTNEVNRSILVTQPDGGKHLYMYRDMSIKLNPHSNEDLIPVTLPLVIVGSGLEAMFEWSDTMAYRNSFYWGPRQFAALSSGYRSNPLQFTNLTVSDYKLSRRRHWLHTEYGMVKVGQTLSMQQDPSPDGIVGGSMTRYAYWGVGGGFQGTMPDPSCVARTNLDGTLNFTYYLRNEWRYPTNVISTYTLPGGGVGLKTNLYFYAENGIDLIQHIGPGGHMEAGYSYDGNHQLLFHTNALNEVTAYTYNNASQVTSIRRPSGLTTTNIYYSSGPSAGFLEKTIDLEILRTNSYTYLNGQVSTHTDERGLTTAYTRDDLQRLTSVSYPDSTYSSNRYDNPIRPLNLSAAKDRLGNWTSYAYDSMQRRTAVTNELGNYTLYTYCTCGSLESMCDVYNNCTSYFYDYQGNLTATHYPDEYKTTNTYNLIGQIINIADSGGNNINRWYNNQGLLVTESNSVGLIASYSYDIEDMLTNSVDVSGVSIGMTYDALHRIRTRTYPDTGAEWFGYTANVSGATSYTNQIGNTMLYAYDVASRKTNEVGVGIYTNKFTYNAAGDLITLKDGKNQTTTWGYDLYGRVTNKVDASSNVLFVYKYDANNRLTNRWSAAKANTYYTYDAGGNLTFVNYPVTPDITLSYDKLNRLTNMVDAVGVTTYGYDTVGQLLSEDGPWSADTVSYTHTHRLRKTLGLLSPNSSPWAQSYDYDVTRRLTNITSQAGAFGYNYRTSLPSTLIAQLSLPGGSYITNSYDVVGRMLSTSLRNSGGTNLNSHIYAYNFAGQRTNQTRGIQGGTNSTWYQITNSVGYTYDSIGQLKTATGQEADTTGRQHERFGYAYDAAGNLNNRTNHTLVQTFNVNSLNELTTVTRSGRVTVEGTTTSKATNVTVNTTNSLLYTDYTFASTNHSLVDGVNTFTAIAKDAYGRLDTNVVTVRLPATSSYVYDLNGNLRTNGTRVFDYDDENQLITITESNTWKSVFTYDGKMRRRLRTECTWNGSAWVTNLVVRYVYDGNLVIQERNGDNLPQVTYTRGSDLSSSLEGAGGIGGLLARTDNTTLSIQSSTTAHGYYHADGNGNVTALVNGNQMIVARYLYDPYGNTLSASGPLSEANLYRFSSKEYHDKSALVYYLYRHYDGNLQRWPNRDPIQEKGGYNLYGFTQNDPVNLYDTDGRWVVPAVIGAAGIWQTACARYAANKALNTFPGDDKKQHCMASCVHNRCTILGAPTFTALGGLLWELRPGGVFDWGDLLADTYGIGVSYNIFRSCENSCKRCPL